MLKLHQNVFFVHASLEFVETSRGTRGVERRPRLLGAHLEPAGLAGADLEHHHAYRWCSPTRRSILSGRFPVSISGQQAPTCSNYLRAPRQSRQPIFLLLE